MSEPLDKVTLMFITSFPAGPWQTNCYLLAPQRGDDLVVIDPGVGAAEIVAKVAAEEGCGIAGVLLTHGHLDHVADAADVADANGVRAWIHEADRELLTDPGPIVPAHIDLKRDLGVDLRQPTQLELIDEGDVIDVGGLSFAVTHAPGHRPGCVMFHLEGTELIFTGDVLFAGSIGRTDLPGGDSAAMVNSLRHILDVVPDEAVLLPGHGPDTTMALERANNPYLQPSFLR